MRTPLLLGAAAVLLGPIACNAILDIREFPASSGAQLRRRWWDDDRSSNRFWKQRYR
jgi:hypothetical protein